jgi:hypothetical protein
MSRRVDDRKHYTMRFYRERPRHDATPDLYVDDHRSWILEGAISDAIDRASKIDPVIWVKPKPAEPREYLYAFIRISEDDTGEEIELELIEGSWRRSSMRA